MNEIFIPVLGLPAAQGSKKHVGRGILVESSKKVAPWRQDVRYAAVEYYKDVPIGLTTKDSRSTFLINRDLMTRFKVNVNPNRKFVLSSWIERSDNNDTRGVNLPLEKL